MRKIRMPFLRPTNEDIDFDEVGGKLMVETAGYIPKEQQIAMLVASGEALENYRKKLFPELEHPNEKSEVHYNPTAQKGYDFFDWHEDVHRAKDGLRQSEIAAQQRAEQEALLAAKAEQENKQESPAPVE